MNALWLWLLATLILSCSSPQQGGVRGGGQTGTGGHATTLTSTMMDGGSAIVTCNDQRCDPNATCSGIGSKAKCTCLPGYEGDGSTCTDIDECKSGAAGCDKNATCVNRPGGFECKCKPEFIKSGDKCIAAAKCGGDSDVCDPNATCSQGASGVECTCNAGYSGDGLGCADVDECSTKGAASCAANAHCVNTFGGYDCACDPGYFGDGNVACKSLCDIARADPSVCAPHGLCRVDGSSAVCDACEPGFTGDGKTCKAASTCGADCDGAGSDPPDTICQSDGTCACAPGFTGTPGSCTDQNECDQKGACGANMACTNDTNGGFACTCKPGFAPDKSGACVDVDECKQTPYPCHPDATCKNKTPGADGVGYECTCKPGFEGDGTVCTDVDECKTDNGGCSENATCINTRGSSSCKCAGDFVGDGKNCYCDLSGVWAMQQDVDTCWAARPVQQGLDEILISAGNVEAYVWSISEYDYDGKQLKTRGKGCGSDRTPDLVSPYFHEVYSSYVPTAAFDAVDMQDGATWDVPGLVPGSTFTTPSEAAVVGIDLGKDPLNAPWPASSGDVTKWVDTDGDGEPGWTLWPRLPSEKTQSGSGNYSYLPAKPSSAQGMFTIAERAGCVSVALRVVTHLEVEVKDCSTMTGKVVNEKTEGRVHSCTLVPQASWGKDITCGSGAFTSQPSCADDDIARLDSDENQVQDSKATFVMKKIGAIGDTFSCEDVQSLLPGPKRTAPTITCTTPQ